MLYQYTTDCTQQNTLYTMEEEASLFTSDTATPWDYNITKGVQKSNTISEEKSKIISPMEIHSQSKHKYRKLAILTYNTMTSIMVMHSLSKTSTQHYYNRNYKTLSGAYMTPS